MTAHNGKLGFNWSVVSKTYEPVPSNSVQFAISGYPALLQKAAAFHTSVRNLAYARYLQGRTSVFTANVIQNPDML